MSSIKMNGLGGLININAVMKGTILTMVTSLFLSLSTGVVYYISSIADLTLPWVTAVILLVSSFCGALYTGKQAGSKGLNNGLATGLLFFLALCLLAGIFLPGQPVISTWSKLLLSLGGGALGGIFGVITN
ncbi:MAG: TIGR04086 family membrane protein [Pelotomaculum sp.]|jgi:putative membrane protein (TIGR04086 family)